MVTTFHENYANQLTGESYSGGALGGLALTDLYSSTLRRTDLALKNSGGSSLASAVFGYDTAGRLSTVGDGTYNATYSYLAHSALISQILLKTNTTTRMTVTRQYDLLNRLSAISSSPSGSGQLPLGFDYQYNDANQRVRVTLHDGSFWIYEYDSLGQVISGKKYWSDCRKGQSHILTPRSRLGMVWRVAREVRIEYPGAVYHLTNRGDRRVAIFRKDADWERFLATLGEAFRKELLARVEERRGASHYGEELRESATEKAERLAREGLRKRGWKEAKLAKRPKGDGAKLELAVQLRRGLFGSPSRQHSSSSNRVPRAESTGSQQPRFVRERALQTAGVNPVVQPLHRRAERSRLPAIPGSALGPLIRVDGGNPEILTSANLTMNDEEKSMDTIQAPRRSASAAESRRHELERLRRMSVEERICASLTMSRRFSWLKPNRQGPARG